MADFTRLLHAPAHVDGHDAFLTIALSGLRPSNVRLLTADEVDGDVNRIPPAQMKGGRWGGAPASQFALAVLSRRDADPLFFAAKGGRPPEQCRQRVA